METFDKAMTFIRYTVGVIVMMFLIIPAVLILLLFWDQENGW